MAKVRRINVSQIEGGYSDDNDVRPKGELALYDNDNGGFDLVLHDGTNPTNLNKILAKGILYGHNGDSGDGIGYDTIKLIPDINLHSNGSNQYVIVDPTAPNHIHLRPGGSIDNSSADLFIGGENTHVKVSDGNGNVVIRASNTVEGVYNYNWTFNNDGSVQFPDSSIQTTAYPGKAGTVATVELSGDPTTITNIAGADTILVKAATGYAGSDEHDLVFQAGRNVNGLRTLVINSSSLCTVNLYLLPEDPFSFAVSPGTVIEVIYIAGEGIFPVSQYSM